MAKSFKERRDLIVKLLNDIKGIKCLRPGGAWVLEINGARRAIAAGEVTVIK